MVYYHLFLLSLASCLVLIFSVSDIHFLGLTLRMVLCYRVSFCHSHAGVMEGMDLPSVKHKNGPVESNKLPIINQRAEILDTIRANQVVLLSGPTGCGKSTQVPQFILDQHAGLRKPVNILVTQPRKIAASSIARRVCKERGWMLGGLVGYQVNNYKLNMCTAKNGQWALLAGIHIFNDSLPY